MTTPPPIPVPPRPDSGPSDPHGAAPDASTPAAGPGMGPDRATSTIALALKPWAGAMGRAGSRAAQAVLLASVAAGIVWLLLQVKLVVVAVLVALILASAVSPLVRWLAGKGWPNLWATAAAFLGILVLVGGLVSGVVLAVRNEWDTLVSSAVRGWEELQDWVMSGPLPVDTAAIDAAARQATDFIASGSFAGNIAGNALTGITAATEFLAGTTLMVVILFFFLKDGPKMWNFALRWFRGDVRAKLAESADRGVEVLGGYVRGTAIVALVDAVIIGLGLAIVGVPLALPLAVIVFIGAFIPIVGATVAGILAALVALVTTGPLAALIVVAIVIGVNQIEGDLLQPVVMGRTLSLHALAVLLALTVGTIVGGIFGAILAVPYTALAWTLVQIWTNQYQTGDDPVLGEDPLNPKDRVETKATMAQRWKYQRMSRQHRRGQRQGAPAPNKERTTPPSDAEQRG